MGKIMEASPSPIRLLGTIIDKSHLHSEFRTAKLSDYRDYRCRRWHLPYGTLRVDSRSVLQRVFVPLCLCGNP